MPRSASDFMNDLGGKDLSEMNQVTKAYEEASTSPILTSEDIGDIGMAFVPGVGTAQLVNFGAEVASMPLDGIAHAITGGKYDEMQADPNRGENVVSRGLQTFTQGLNAITTPVGDFLGNIPLVGGIFKGAVQSIPRLGDGITEISNKIGGIFGAKEVETVGDIQKAKSEAELDAAGEEAADKKVDELINSYSKGDISFLELSASTGMMSEADMTSLQDMQKSGFIGEKDMAALELEAQRLQAEGGSDKNGWSQVVGSLNQVYAGWDKKSESPLKGFGDTYMASVSEMGVNRPEPDVSGIKTDNPQAALQMA